MHFSETSTNSHLTYTEFSKGRKNQYDVVFSGFFFSYSWCESLDRPSLGLDTYPRRHWLNNLSGSLIARGGVSAVSQAMIPSQRVHLCKIRPASSRGTEYSEVWVFKLRCVKEYVSQFTPRSRQTFPTTPKSNWLYSRVLFFTFTEQKTSRYDQDHTTHGNTDITPHTITRVIILPMGILTHTAKSLSSVWESVWGVLLNISSIRHAHLTRLWVFPAVGNFLRTLWYLTPLSHELQKHVKYSWWSFLAFRNS